jgi:hypothetical protein
VMHHLWPGETTEAIALEAKRVELEKRFLPRDRTLFGGGASP